ncbi:MAG: hypothetical protein QJR06_06405 [Alicyclobacillaceae bacterium]|nr:hypothetical protein [Alicyclobacillaceae bacterium]
MFCWTDVYNGITVFTLEDGMLGAAGGRRPPRSGGAAVTDPAQPAVIHVVGGCGGKIAKSADLIALHRLLNEWAVPHVAYVANDVRQLLDLMRMAKCWGIHPRASYFNHLADALQFLDGLRVPVTMTA